MDKRKHARKILEKARNLLAERLVDAILESEEDLLDDADGHSYMDEISALQERVGDRLNKVNLMLSNLPANDPSNFESNNVKTTEVDAVDQQLKPTNEVSPPSTVNPSEANAQRPADFALFGQQIMANDLAGAGQTLSVLMDVDPELSLRCATSFRDRLNADPATTQKAMLLRTKLKTGQTNDSLMILWECFRLQGPQAIQVMQALQIRLTNA